MRRSKFRSILFGQRVAIRVVSIPIERFKTLNHHDKKISRENPVGPESPNFAFDIPLWKVFVTLFLVAIVLTAFKFYERHNIAPKQEIRWQTFDLTIVQQEQRRRRNILIKVIPDPKNVPEKSAAVFKDPDVQSSIYLDKTVCLEIDEGLFQSEPVARWLSENAADLVDGGVWFTRSDGSPMRTVSWNELSVDVIRSWIDP